MYYCYNIKDFNEDGYDALKASISLPLVAKIIDYDNKSKDDLYTRSFFERIQQFYAFNSKYINEMNLEEINRMLSSSTYINLFKK